MRYLKRKGFLFILVSCVIGCVLFFKCCRHKNKRYPYLLITNRKIEIPIDSVSLSAHYNVIKNYFEKRKNWTTSNIGSILFKNEDINNFKEQNRNFTIWIHKYWHYHQLRHRNLENYTRHCRVKNCKFIKSRRGQVDAVLVNIYFGVFPRKSLRNPNEIWILHSDESPMNKFKPTKRNIKLSIFANIYNWSFTYRHDSEIPMPYGRVVPLNTPLIPNFKMSNPEYYSPQRAEEFLKILVPHWESKRKDVLITTLYSNCMDARDMVIDELSKNINVHVYGLCSKDPILKKSCPYGFIHSQCEATTKYLFYLVMENSQCFEYITEKSYYHGFTHGAIPIMIGPSFEDCQLHFPPNSFIYLKTLEDLRLLSDTVTKIGYDRTELLKYHAWRNHFSVKNEHGCFGTESKYMCRICEALNYNNHTHSVYDEGRIKSILDPDVNCFGD